MNLMEYFSTNKFIYIWWISFTHGNLYCLRNWTLYFAQCQKHISIQCFIKAATKLKRREFFSQFYNWINEAIFNRIHFKCDWIILTENKIEVFSVFFHFRFGKILLIVSSNNNKQTIKNQIQFKNAIKQPITALSNMFNGGKNMVMTRTQNNGYWKIFIVMYFLHLSHRQMLFRYCHTNNIEKIHLIFHFFEQMETCYHVFLFIVCWIQYSFDEFCFVWTV